ncbi:MAG: DUF4065 domain-containing protein [Coriobacteriia bacterium]
MDTVFCPNCMADVEYLTEERPEVLPVRGEDIEVSARVAVCSSCGEDVWVDEFEDETLAAAYSLYRQKHGLLTPEEIASIRKRWGIGQRAFSLLLGWGEITLHRYESGSIQDKAHDTQLRMAGDPSGIRTLLQANGQRLTKKQRETVEKRLAEEEAVACDDELENILARETSPRYGGSVPLSLAKVREMVAYFCQSKDMFVTKLAKLMFYADFLHYKQNTTSITGLAYVHLKYGPVPEHYERIRADLLENGIVQVEARTGDDWEAEVLVALRPADVSVFEQSELEAMRYLRDELGSMTSKRVSELSHSESAYQQTAMGERIPYEKAGELSLSLRR